MNLLLTAFFVLLSSISLGLTLPSSTYSSTDRKSNAKCSYEGCPRGDPKKLNVHLVAHTHDDVGWLKTVDQYFYGINNGNIQRAGVQYILDTTIQQLLENPERRFIYVETSFFWKWWMRQTEKTRLAVKDLVQEGRLEFIGGGWSMNDEATVHYNSVIDQMTWGHRKLNDTFGKCGLSRVAWQIDPFGHSQEQASLFAQMFMDGLFVGRVDYADKSKREKEKKMEFVWQSNQGIGKSSDLFTGVLPNGYGPPGGFCFDDTCGDTPFVDDKSSEEYNVDGKVNDFINQANDQAKRFATNHIIMTMGSDFQYQNAIMWFKNLDMLIKYVNQKGSNVNVFYSTPSCYLKALNEANVTWSTKTDDFFPYASDPHAYWTGYFTSRPALKRFERVSNNWLQACKQLQVLSRIHNEDDLSLFKESMGINQHHDAVSGTEKQHVANDYALQLSKGLLKCYEVVDKSYAELLPKKPDVHVHRQHFCPGLNISECSFTETEDKIAVTLYNPRVVERETVVRLPWTSDVATVMDDNGAGVKAIISDVMESVKKLPERKSKASKEITFNAKLPALGFATYFVSKKASPFTQRMVPMEMTRESNPVEFKGKSFSAFFDPVTGYLRSVKLGDGTSVKVRSEYLWYEGMRGDNSNEGKRASGAYIFRPNGTNPHPFDSKNVKANFYKNEMVNEVHQEITPWLSQVVRVYTNGGSIEFDWAIGPIPTDDNIGKEIVAKFSTDLDTRSVFYTDANGRQILKRTRNYRPTWTLNVTEPVSGNYYPVNSRIMLKDAQKDVQVTVLTDRSQGGASIEDGTVELMIHRRLLDDDAFGVGEALKEPGYDGKGLIVLGKHVVMINKLKSDSFEHRSKGLDMYLEPIITFSVYESVASHREQFNTRWSALTRQLPPNVHILTLEEWKDSSVLLRLEHFYDSNDDPNNLSKPVTFSLTSLFAPFGIAHARETTMSANQWLSDAKRLSWKTSAGETSQPSNEAEPSPANDFKVTLKPLQIRTFILRLNERMDLNDNLIE